jgi:DNA replication protein DnaC
MNGGVGNGKTHLCQALTIVLNQRGIDAYYYRVPDLLKTLRAAIDTHDSDDWVKSLSNVQALVLDDFGLEAQTMWSTANIEDIIDARWQEKRITVMTTNKNIIDLPARIQSRFRDTDLSVYVLNAGKDYRTAKR